MWLIVLEAGTSKGVDSREGHHALSPLGRNERAREVESEEGPHWLS